MDLEAKEDLKMWVAFFAEFSYKPNFEFKVDSNLGYGPPMLEMIMLVPDSRSEMNERPLVRITQRSALPPRLTGSNAMAEAAALDWLRREIWRMEDHETNEWIRYKGELVFDPHRED